MAITVAALVVGVGVGYILAAMMISGKIEDLERELDRRMQDGYSDNDIGNITG